MEPNDLKNYGKSLIEMMGSVPQEKMKEISDSSFNIIKKHLNSDELKRFTISLEAEKERMLKMNLSSVNEKGLNSEEFIHQQIEWAASFNATSNIIGREKALNVHREITEKNLSETVFLFVPDIRGSE